MIVKLGDSLGETFGNFVGRLAATPAVLTPVIPAFRASVLVVHPILPDRDHSAMLTMVKDGKWFSPNPPKRCTLELTLGLMGKGRRTGPARFQ